MYGFKAISAASGWSITLAGLAIVFTGLVILSVLIANMEKLLMVWDRKSEWFRARNTESKARKGPSISSEKPDPQDTSIESPVATIRLSETEREVIEHFRLITQRQGEPFSLSRLLERAEKSGILHPHRHLDTFLKLRLIVECEGDLAGFYQWRKDVQILPAEVEKH